MVYPASALETAAALPKMAHRHFADWYESVSLRHDSNTLDARWKAVEQLLDSLKISAAPGLVRTFFDLPGADSYCEEIRSAAKLHDTSYLISNDRNELTVLSGGVIAASVEKSSHLADAVALAVSCADAQGMRQAKRIQGVVDETSKYLAEDAVRTRQVNVDIKVLDIDASGLTKLLGMKGGVTINDFNSGWTASEAIFKELITSHTKHTDSVQTVLKLVLQTEKEKSNILWWIVSEYTLDGAKPFSKLHVPEACYWGARDLAHLTIYLPGPLGGPAYLHRMLRTVKSKLPSLVTVSECVEACDSDWKKDWAKNIAVQQLPDLCPMLFALTKSVEVGAGKEWVAAFVNATGLAEGSKAEPVRLATQVYNELLLLRALEVKD
jgi:hypothetical protein